MPTTLAGRYQLVRKIGAGGMGKVFEATDSQTGRPVAAKILMASDEDNLDALLRFYQEGALLSTLKHPNIVRVYGTFLEEQTCAIIMELIEGQSLAEVLRTGPLSLPRAKHLAHQAALALEYAHGRGIIHRDIKPGNVMVRPDDHVKVTDFGIARVVRHGATLNTVTGMTLGTPLYMAPEQIEAGKVDGRADIYSLGSVVYQMVTGRPPFEGDDPLSIAFMHVHKPPAPPAEIQAGVPEDWEALILKALAKDPADRFQSAAQMAEAISRLGGEPSTDSRPAPDASQTAVPPLRARPAPAPEPPAPAPGPVQPSPDPESPPAAVVPSAPPPSSAAPAAAEQSWMRRRWPILAASLVGALILAGALIAYAFRPTSSRPTSSAVVSRLLRTLGGGGTGPGQFKGAEDVAVDTAGNVYVADMGNNRIQKLSPSGKPLAAWGTSGDTAGLFAGPTGVALDDVGNIYVADSNHSTIEKIAPDGAVLDHWGGQGTNPGQFSGLHSVAVDAQGDIYAADFGNNRIQKLSPSGQVLAVWGDLAGGSAAGQFHGPVSVAVDGHGDVYVADFYNDRVQELSPSGRPLTQFTTWGAAGTGTRHPHGVAVDAHGDVYIADFANRDVVELSPSGKTLAEWGSGGSHPGHFVHPVAVAVDARGDLYVTDEVENRVDVFSPAS
ncbi:MAG: protein kinase [Chloroflexi bacterium]|nr:protein kinase [Chloroflexota bacterium]